MKITRLLDLELNWLIGWELLINPSDNFKNKHNYIVICEINNKQKKVFSFTLNLLANINKLQNLRDRNMKINRR